jgi:hypothetical protein
MTSSHISRKPRHLRIFRQQISFNEILWSVDLHDGLGGTKRLRTFRTRREAIAAAKLLCRKLHVAVRGRFSAFYKKIKRAECICTIGFGTIEFPDRTAVAQPSMPTAANC